MPLEPRAGVASDPPLALTRQRRTAAAAIIRHAAVPAFARPTALVARRFALRCCSAARSSPVRCRLQVVRPDLGAAERLVIAKTNEFRAGQRLAPTKPDPKLADAARDFAGLHGAHRPLRPRGRRQVAGRSRPGARLRLLRAGREHRVPVEPGRHQHRSAARYGRRRLEAVAGPSPQHARAGGRRHRRRVRAEPDVAALLRGPAVRPAALGDAPLQRRQCHCRTRFATGSPGSRSTCRRAPPGTTSSAAPARSTSARPTSGSPIEPGDGERYTLEAVGGTGVACAEE